MSQRNPHSLALSQPVPSPLASPGTPGAGVPADSCGALGHKAPDQLPGSSRVRDAHGPGREVRAPTSRHRKCWGFLVLLSDAGERDPGPEPRSSLNQLVHLCDHGFPIYLLGATTLHLHLSKPQPPSRAIHSMDSATRLPGLESQQYHW